MGASYPRTIESIKRRLKANPVPVQLPIGEEEGFVGVIDLLGGRAFHLPGGTGTTAAGLLRRNRFPCQREYEDSYQEYRQEMIEKIVETDEKLLIQYLEGEDLKEEDLRSALREATIQRQLVPVLCGSAISGKGVHPLIDAIVDFLPSPAGRAAGGGRGSQV